MHVLEGGSITKRFGARTVIADATFSFDSGDLVLIQGRSGTGKSTLLNIIAGMDVPDSGWVRVDGKDLAGLDEEERAAFRLRHLGFVFQHFNLIPDLNAWENVALPMKLDRRRGSRERAHELLASFGLAELSESFPATLSGGEMQRVAIARSLANDPAVVLADEPTANLDEENARIVMRELERIASGGRVVVVASHDPLLLESRCRRLTLLSGRLEPLAAEAHGSLKVGSPPAASLGGATRSSPRAPRRKASPTRRTPSRG